MPRKKGAASRKAQSSEAQASRPRRAPRRKRAISPRRALVLTLAVAASLLVIGALALLVVYPRGQAQPESSRAAALGERELSIGAEESPRQVAERLAGLGLLDDPALFATYLELRRMTPMPGPHLLPGGLSRGELAARLARRGERTKLVVPEGLSRFDIANRLAAAQICSRAAFLAATQDRQLLSRFEVNAESLEGRLFPATYELGKNSEPGAIVQRMVSEFERRFEPLQQKHAGVTLTLFRELGFGVQELLTLASMVEREAKIAEERPRVASVFFNRLREPKETRGLLQSDPSSGYGCRRALELRELRLAEVSVPPSCTSYAGTITSAINNDRDNPYSSYTHAGLPPGPIANPGLAAIEAVLAPEQTRYFYFMADGRGGHSFAETYDEHKKNVAAARGR